MSLLAALAVVTAVVLGFGAVVLAFALIATGSDRERAPIGQMLDCAACGRRRHRERMVPVRSGSGVAWTCEHCVRQGSHARATAP